MTPSTQKFIEEIEIKIEESLKINTISLIIFTKDLQKLLQLYKQSQEECRVLREALMVITTGEARNDDHETAAHSNYYRLRAACSGAKAAIAKADKIAGGGE